MVKKDTRVAKLKGTPLSKIESRPWKCPCCGRRCAKKNALMAHYKKRSLGTLPADVCPSARDGYLLPTPKATVKKNRSRKDILKEGRDKGSRAKNRIRSKTAMKEGIRDYDKALENGESAAEYKERTGVSKQKIKFWRDSVKKQKN